MGTVADLDLFTLTISPATLSISGTPITTATSGVAYTGFTVSASGGVPAYTYSIFSGSLPTGITINSSTGAVSGTPTVDGTFADIVIRVTDSLGTTANLAPFSLVVAAASTGFVQNNIAITVSAGGTSSSSASITTIDTTKSIALSYGLILGGASTTGGLKDFFMPVTLTSTTASGSYNTATSSAASISINLGIVELPVSIVDSVQVVTASLTGTQAAGSVFNVAIPTPVDKSRSFAIFQRETTEASASSNSQNAQHVVDISAAGTNVEILAASILASTNRSFRVQIVQLKTGVLKNKVDFTIAIPANGSSVSNSYSLSSLNSGAGVTDANTIIIPRGEIQTAGAGSNGINIVLSSVGRSGNTVTMTKGTASATIALTTHNTALEFNSGYISVQNTSLSLSTAQTSNTATISSIDTARTFLLINGMHNSASTADEARYFAKVNLTNATTLTMSRFTSGTTVVTCYPQVVTLL
jgi:hypothetical protein